MKFNKTNDIYADLIQKLKTSGYSKSYVERLETEINWLIRNQNREDIQSYGDACRIRISRTKSREMQITYRRVYKTLENFDLYGKYPSGVYAGTSARRGSVWEAVSKVYRAAGVRQGEGERQGTHLFRHHVASALAGNGIARPVISETLGHTASKSLDCYLSADIQHLREYAHSALNRFPSAGRCCRYEYLPFRIFGQCRSFCKQP